MKLTLVEIQSLFKENHLPLDRLDEDRFHLIFNYLAVMWDIVSLFQTPERSNQIVRKMKAEAAKLTSLFVDAADVNKFIHQLDYIKCIREKKDMQLLLPQSDSWMPDIWAGILRRQQPSSFNDLILRVLPYADKIERYVLDHLGLLKAEIQVKVEQEYVDRFKNEYTALQQQEEVTLNSIKKNYKKKIARDTDRLMETYFREALDLPSFGQLEPTQIKQLKERKSKPIENDNAQREKFENAIVKALLDRDIRRFSAADVPKCEVEYVAARLKQARVEIQKVTELRQQHILSPNTSLSALVRYASQVYYARARENPQVAELFFRKQVSEEKFNLYLDLEPVDDPEAIPPVTLAGKDFFGLDDYRLEKLAPDDVRVPLIGRATSCCQCIGGAAESSIIQGITNPRGGFYALMKGGKVVAQCWAWRGMDDEIVFDSVELHIDHRDEPDVFFVERAFIELADILVKKHGVPRVLVGIGEHAETPEKLRIFEIENIAYRLMQNRDYTDAPKQALLAQDGLPIKELYYALTVSLPIHFEALTNFTFTDKQALFDWFELCEDNEKEQWSKVFKQSYGQEFSDWRALDKQINKVVGCLARKKSTEEQAIAEINKLAAMEGKPNYTVLLSGALQKGFVRAAKYLHQLGANVSSVSCALSALDRAICNHDMAPIEFVINASLNLELQLDDKRNTMFDIVINHNQLTIVNMLLAKGVTPPADALFAAVKAKNVDMLKVLLEAGVDPNATHTKYSDTVLHAAIEDGFIEAMPLLIQYHANIELKNSEGETLLLLALHEHNIKLARELIANGANINAVADDGLGVLQALAIFNSDPITDEGKQLFTELLAKGLDLYAKDKQGRTVLHHLVENYSYDWIMYLLDEHAFDRTVCDDDGKTAIQLYEDEYQASLKKNDVLNKCARMLSEAERIGGPLEGCEIKPDADAVSYWKMQFAFMPKEERTPEGIVAFFKSVAEKEVVQYRASHPPHTLSGGFFFSPRGRSEYRVAEHQGWSSYICATFRPAFEAAKAFGVKDDLNTMVNQELMTLLCEYDPPQEASTCTMM